MRKQFFGGALQHGPTVIFARLKWDTLCDHNSSFMSEKCFLVGERGDVKGHIALAIWSVEKVMSESASSCRVVVN